MVRMPQIEVSNPRLITFQITEIMCICYDRTIFGNLPGNSETYEGRQEINDIFKRHPTKPNDNIVDMMENIDLIIILLAGFTDLY